VSRFDELPLSPRILKGIRKMGFREMTPIQVEAILLLLEGWDVIGQAQTGTGKTAAFSIPLIAKIDPEKPYTQGLVLAPTRELAEQIASHIRGLARYTGARILCLHGGGNINRQAALLEHPVHIIVATPGRLLDLIYRRRCVDLGRVKVAVVDEVDKMLEMGFIKEVKDILSKLPFTRQTSMWSATISSEVKEIATRYMRHPRKISVSENDISQKNVDQYYVRVSEDNRVNTLYSILNSAEVDRGFIFCNTRESVERLVEEVKAQGYLVESLHGGYIQKERNQAYTKLLKRQVRFLVSTDIASRGIDIKGITHVINYEVPEDPEVYFHRVGRTGRIRKKGVAITLVSESELKYWEKIKEMTPTSIKEYKPASTG